METVAHFPAVRVVNIPHSRLYMLTYELAGRDMVFGPQLNVGGDRLTADNAVRAFARSHEGTDWIDPDGSRHPITMVLAHSLMTDRSGAIETGYQVYPDLEADSFQARRAAQLTAETGVLDGWPWQHDDALDDDEAYITRLFAETAGAA